MTTSGRGTAIPDPTRGAWAPTRRRPSPPAISSIGSGVPSWSRSTKALPIHGVSETEGQVDLLVFHAGTASAPSGVVTAGGRVLGVTGLGDTFTAARERAYEGVRRILFDGMHYRSDIGARALSKR